MDNLLRSQMGVSEEHPWVFVTGDNCNLWDVQPKLKEALDGFLAKVKEAKIRQASTSSEPNPRQPEAVIGDREE